MIELDKGDMNTIFKNTNINKTLNNNDINKISLLLGYNINFIKLLDKDKYIHIFLIYFNEITISYLKEFNNNIILFNTFIKNILLNNNNLYSFDENNINNIILFLKDINMYSSDLYKILNLIINYK